MALSEEEQEKAMTSLARDVVNFVSALRSKLKKMGIEFSHDDKSLMLIEKILCASYIAESEFKLFGLRTIQSVRTNIASHARGKIAAGLEWDALSRYETYPAHFEETCRTITDELKRIERALA